ncbi:MAG TPA: ABC transporter permease [Gemmatimonadaceae bacterium]|jgi:predicted permease|nr:ABC transporter permease [Gemmatimonadaceae bacterium]
MNDAARQVRIALRGLRRTPAFTAAAILILGFGIGTAVAMFTVFRAVLLERLPVRDPERVVVLSTYKDPKVEYGLVSPHIKAVQRESRTIRLIGAFAHWGTSQGPLVDGDRTLTMGRVVVTGTFFQVLGTRPFLGRLFKAEDDQHGAAPVLVLSYKAWRRDFGGDSSIVGRHLYEPYSQLNYTVVGIAPPGLDYPTGAEYWIIWPEGNLSVIAIARLAPGVTPSAAAAELLSIVQRVSPEFHVTGAKAIGLTQAILGDVRPILLVLTGAVALLLLIACVNVGGLLLLRAGSRARELAIRRALGATYGDVVKQLLLESGLLAVAGGAFGIVCAQALTKVLLVLAPTQLPRAEVIELSGTPIAAGIGVTMLTVLLFGVVPSVIAARTDVAGTLRLDTRSGRDSMTRRRFRHVLVGAQTMLALMMLAGGALLARSLARLQSLNLGYDADHLTMLATSWPSKKYDSVSKMYPLGEDVIRRWRAIPGVVAVTPTLIPPLVGDNVFLGRLDREGQSESDRASNPIVPIESGGKEYFRTLGTPLLRGRPFEDADRENAELVAIVSESVARLVWPGQDPIGKRIHYWTPDSVNASRRVIGVAADTHLRIFRAATPTVYVPWRQAGFWQFNFAIRTSGEIGTVLPALRREARAVDPQLMLWYVHPMDELLAKPLARPRMSAVLMSMFAGAALLLAAIGLYGLMASVVRESTREIGIRMALGAAPERLRRDVLGQALAVSGAGAIIGLVVTLFASRLLAAMLFDVSPTDPVALVTACVVLLIVVTIAAYVPARWATRVDPASALRSD